MKIDQIIKSDGKKYQFVKKIDIKYTFNKDEYLENSKKWMDEAFDNVSMVKKRELQRSDVMFVMARVRNSCLKI
jgi:hypothetical protein